MEGKLPVILEWLVEVHFITCKTKRSNSILMTQTVTGQPRTQAPWDAEHPNPPAKPGSDQSLP